MEPSAETTPWIFVLSLDAIVRNATLESQRRVKVWRWANVLRMISFSSKEFFGSEYFPLAPRSNERTCWKAEVVVSICAHCLMRNALLTVICRPRKDRAAVENSRAASEQARRVASSSLTCSRMMEIISCGRIRQRGGAQRELREVN